jgi:hypothetical protein
MHRLLVAELINLFAATEAVGNEDGHGSRGLHCRQQAVVGDGLGHFKFVRFKSKRTCHAATAGLDGLDDGARTLEQRDLARRTSEDSLVMTVAVQQDMRTLKPAGNPVRSLGCEPVGKEPYLFIHSLRARVVREELEKLILEYAGATRLEKDERHSRFDLRRHAVENFGEIRTSLIEQAEIIKWTAAADVALRRFDLEAGFHQHRFGGGEGLRMVIVVPGIRPEHDLR